MRIGDAMIVLDCSIAEGSSVLRLLLLTSEGFPRPPAALFCGSSYFNSADHLRHLDAAEREG